MITYTIAKSGNVIGPLVEVKGNGDYVIKDWAWFNERDVVVKASKAEILGKVKIYCIYKEETTTKYAIFNRPAMSFFDIVVNSHFSGSYYCGPGRSFSNGFRIHHRNKRFIVVSQTHSLDV